MAERMQAQGVEHLWLDATGLDDFAERFPTITASLAAIGLDPSVDWLPIAPAAHHLSGGVVTDLSGATALPGLWAAGEVACTGVHGANRLASNSLLEGMVFGARLAEAILDGHDGPSPTGVMRPCWPVARAPGTGAGRVRPVRTPGRSRRRPRGRSGTGIGDVPTPPRPWGSTTTSRSGGPPAAGDVRRRRRGPLGRLAGRGPAGGGGDRPVRPPRGSAADRRATASWPTWSPRPGRSWPPPPSAPRPGGPTPGATSRRPRTGGAAGSSTGTARWACWRGRSARNGSPVPPDDAPPAERSARPVAVDPPHPAVVEAVARALAEDLLPLGDLTAALVPPTVVCTVAVVSRAAGVVAGGPAPSRRFAQVDPTVAVDWYLPDGSPLVAGHVVAGVDGPLRSILTAERTALNFLGHLSGVATLTRRLVDAVAAANPGHPGPRHPQDHPRAAGPGEGGGAGRRRAQPPGQPLRGRAGQGQPPGRGDHHRGGPAGAVAVAGPDGGGGVRPARAGGRGGGRRRHGGAARQHDARPGGVVRRPGPGRRAPPSSSRSPAASTSTPPRATRPPVPTCCRWGR